MSKILVITNWRTDSPFDIYNSLSDLVFPYVPNKFSKYEVVGDGYFLTKKVKTTPKAVITPNGKLKDRKSIKYECFNRTVKDLWWKYIVSNLVRKYSNHYCIVINTEK